MKTTLRGAILQKYPSACAFGKAMGWNRQKASDIMNGRRTLSANEMISIAQKIGVDDADSFMSIFFPSMSTK